METRQVARVKTRTREIQKRIDTLEIELERLKPGEAVSLDELSRRLSAALGIVISDAMLRYSLLELRKDVEDRNSSSGLEIGRDYVRVLAKEETSFDQKMQSNVMQKRVISSALWHWLFKFPLMEGVTVDKAWLGTRVSTENQTVKMTLERKLLTLQKKVNLGIGIDAGSSNTIAIESFLRTASSIPFQIDMLEKMGNEEIPYHKLISPLFLTNSIVIADRIARSKHRHSILLRVIGGTERPDSRSICGELSLLWLRACHHEGKMISLDITIIGATGVEQHRLSSPAFGCDSAEEAGLKSRLLAMSHFRIVLLDSTKIASGSSNSIFASISIGDVDLIVTDAGINDSMKEDVNDLIKICHENNVGLLIANLPKS